MVLIAADEAKRISIGSWENWCDTVTNGNRGRLISIDFVGDEEAARTLAKDVALVAIDYDSVFKGNRMVISYGDDSAPYRHIVQAPIALWQGQDANGRVVAIELEDEDGHHTILTLA